MRPLRFVALSADGQAMILTDEVGRMLSLAIDDQVIAAVQRESTGTPGQLSMDVEATLTPRDIQSRIRSGETAEHVARLANVPMEKVLRFAGPVLQERAAMAQLARRTRLRGADSGQTLADVVDSRLRAHGVDVETVAWDSHRRDDGGWRTTATWPSGKATAHAIWDLDRSRSMVTPVDEMANFLSSEQDLLIGPDEQNSLFGPVLGAEDADPKEGPVVPALSMLRRRDERRREELQPEPQPVAREVPRELPREAAGQPGSGRGRALDPRFDDFRRVNENPAARMEPATRPPSGPGAPAAGLPPAGRPAAGLPPTGRPGGLPPASQMPRPEMPHPDLPRPDMPRPEMPRPDMPRPNAGRPEMPGVDVPGVGAPAASAGRGAGWLDDPRERRSGTDSTGAEEVRRPDPWGDPRRPAGRRGDPLPGAARPTSGAGRTNSGDQPAPGAITGRGDWRERLDPTGVGSTPPAPPAPPAPTSKSARARKAELPSWDDILFGSGSGRRGS